MDILHKEYKIAKSSDSRMALLEEQLKNTEPPVYLRISPDAKMSLSCGEGIDFESCWQRYLAVHNSSYLATRDRLFRRLISMYDSLSRLHEFYKDAPKSVQLNEISLQSAFRNSKSAIDKEISDLRSLKENLPLKKYKVRPLPQSVLVSRQKIEDDLRNEAMAICSGCGLGKPSERVIRTFIQEHIEDVLARERRNAEELAEFNRKVEETLAISLNSEFQKEYEVKVREIESRIQQLESKRPFEVQFYEEELKSFDKYLSAFFRNFKAPYPMDVMVEYDQNTTMANVTVSFPKESDCELPTRIAKIKGKEIQVYELSEDSRSEEYAKSITGMAYFIAISILAHNPYLSAVIVQGIEKGGKNGLFAAMFNRTAFKTVDIYEESISKLMAPFIVVGDYKDDRYAFSPIPLNQFRQQLKPYILEGADGRLLHNTILVTIEQAIIIVTKIHSSLDVAELLEDAFKSGRKWIRIPSKYAATLIELGMDYSQAQTRDSSHGEDEGLKLVGESDIELEKRHLACVDLFFEWQKNKKDVLELRGVTEVDNNRVRFTQRVFQNRYSTKLLKHFNFSAYGLNYIYVTKSLLAKLETAHMPEEYAKYLCEFGNKRAQKAREFEAEGKPHRAIKEYERCLEYGCPLKESFDNLIRLYNEKGDSINASRVMDLKQKTWG